MRAILERAAAKKGGDRYSVQPVDKNGEPWTIYVPQEISRGSNSSPAVTLEIQITRVD